jgi:hypothetical protein
LNASEVELDAIREGIAGLLFLSSNVDDGPREPYEAVLEDFAAELERVRVDFQPAAKEQAR